MRFPDISGALWCVENSRIMSAFLIFLVPSGVLKRIELSTISYLSGACWCVGKGKIYQRCLDISGAFWCVGKNRIMSDFLKFLMPSGVLEKVGL